jgi:hypothetical protein
MKCCSNCFGDPFLSREIERLSDTVGHCDFCGSNDVRIVNPSELADYLEKPLSVYTESSDAVACSIQSLLRKDWALFDRLDVKQAELLLGQVFNDSTITEKKYVPVIQIDSSAIQEWEDFREELKHRNRFFPKKFVPTKELRKLFGILTARPEDIPNKVYRARICEHSAPYPIAEMGKPPSKFSGSGRANPMGIPCLYVASDTETAIAEIRPHKGELVCVAEFEVTKDIELADLRNPRKTISPFQPEDEQIKLIFQRMGFLCRLGEELTLPILPKTANLDYLPSQYICEFIKDCGFNGVIYNSSLGSGINYAIFDDAGVIGKKVQQYKIDTISIGFTGCQP